MRVISITVGVPREVPDGDDVILTGIYKEPVAGPVEIDETGVAGDGQADPEHHGGHLKAVYAYPAEHYALWQRELGRTLGWGQFGENLTIVGLDERALHSGDILRVGTAVLRVTQPRKPCRKLGLRMGEVGFVKRFWRAGRMGIYFEVVSPGFVKVGDSVEIVEQNAASPTVHEIWQLASDTGEADVALLRCALTLPHLSEEWLRLLRARLEAQGG